MSLMMLRDSVKCSFYPLLPPRTCATCGTSLSKSPVNGSGGVCSLCEVIHYCCDCDRVAHYPKHQWACHEVLYSRDTMFREEYRLRFRYFEIGLPANPFERLGGFWTLKVTETYMLVKRRHVEALVNINTTESLEQALKHCKDMLRLDSGDHLGMRHRILGLLLRLDKDRECYDLIKLFTTSYSDGQQTHHDPRVPYRQIMEADILAPHLPLPRSRLGLCELVALTLIHIRLCDDLKNLQNLNKVARLVYLPDGLWTNVRGLVTRNSALDSHDNLLRSHQDGWLRLMEGRMQSEWSKFWLEAHKRNKWFWKTFVNPRQALVVAANHDFIEGTAKEAHCALHLFYNSWKETPGAIAKARVMLEGMSCMDGPEAAGRHLSDRRQNTAPAQNSVPALDGAQDTAQETVH